MRALEPTTANRSLSSVYRPLHSGFYLLPSAFYNRPMPEEQLTRLQQIILDIEKLGLPLRDAMRLATQQVGFFVGQQRYLEERDKALAMIQGQPEEAAGGTGL